MMGFVVDIYIADVRNAVDKKAVEGVFENLRGAIAEEIPCGWDKDSKEPRIQLCHLGYSRYALLRKAAKCFSYRQFQYATRT